MNRFSDKTFGPVLHIGQCGGLSHVVALSQYIVKIRYVCAHHLELLYDQVYTSCTLLDLSRLFNRTAHFLLVWLRFSTRPYSTLLLRLCWHVLVWSSLIQTPLWLALWNRNWLFDGARVNWTESDAFLGKHLVDNCSLHCAVCQVLRRLFLREVRHDPIGNIISIT